jgi:hypothetical protein
VVNRLLQLLQEGGRITRRSESPLSSTGLPYYFAEITFENESQFVLQAYEEEAVQLFQMVMIILAGKAQGEERKGKGKEDTLSEITKY